MGRPVFVSNVDFNAANVCYVCSPTIATDRNYPPFYDCLRPENFVHPLQREEFGVMMYLRTTSSKLSAMNLFTNPTSRGRFQPVAARPAFITFRSSSRP